MANRILLLCAAATPGLRQGRFPGGGAPGAPDAPNAPDALDMLDEQGRAAIAAAQNLLADPRDAHCTVFSSPAAAALQTAAALDFVPHVDAALRDADYGQWSGCPLKDIAHADPERLHAWLTDEAVAPPMGESFTQVLARVDAWLEAMLTAAAKAPTHETAKALANVSAADFAQRSVVAVTHPVVMRAAALRCDGVSLGVAARMDIAPLSIMTLERRHDAWTALPRTSPSVMQSR